MEQGVPQQQQPYVQHRTTTAAAPGLETVSVDINAVKINVTRTREWQPGEGQSQLLYKLTYTDRADGRALQMKAFPGLSRVVVSSQQRTADMDVARRQLARSRNPTCVRESLAVQRLM